MHSCMYPLNGNWRIGLWKSLKTTTTILWIFINLFIGCHLKESYVRFRIWMLWSSWWYHDTGMSLNASDDLVSALAGRREFVGKAGTLLIYFQKQAAENPCFYYAVQLDIDETITNILQITDILGIPNRQRVPTICSFYQTTISKWQWFLVLHCCTMKVRHHLSGYLKPSCMPCWGKSQPITIFTDQDQAIARVISQSIAWCLSWIMQFLSFKLLVQGWFTV